MSSLSLAGSEFQTIGPATENVRRPSVLRWWRGTSSWRRRAERSRWRSAMSETAMQQSDRYFGTLLCRHRWTVTASLYRTRSATSSQCKSECRICDSPRSYLLVPLTRRAAAFSTRCSLSVTDLGAPARIMLQCPPGPWRRREQV